MDDNSASFHCVKKPKTRVPNQKSPNAQIVNGSQPWMFFDERQHRIDCQHELFSRAAAGAFEGSENFEQIRFRPSLPDDLRHSVASTSGPVAFPKECLLLDRPRALEGARGLAHEGRGPFFVPMPHGVAVPPPGLPFARWKGRGRQAGVRESSGISYSKGLNATIAKLAKIRASFATARPQIAAA